MPYCAENKEQADNGLQFWKNEKPDGYDFQVSSLGQVVYVKEDPSIPRPPPR